MKKGLLEIIQLLAKMKEKIPLKKEKSPFSKRTLILLLMRISD